MMDRVILSRGAGLLVVGLTIVHLSCKHAPTEPVTPPKDPRTYTFTVDTLAYPDAFQTNMYAIDGSSARDVYAVGFNSTSSIGTMYHYDGTRWSTTGFHSTEGRGGPISGPVDFASVQVFSPTDVWFVGARTRLNPNPPPNFIDSSFILHYDGRNWMEHKVYGARELLSVSVALSNSIWACGFHGTLIHYDGIQWRNESIPIAPPDSGGITLRKVLTASDEVVYMLGFAYVVESGVERILQHYFFRRTSGGWRVVDSTAINNDGDYRWGTVDLWASPTGVLYSVSPVGVWRWDGSAWTRILDWHGGPLQSIWGYGNDSFFVGGYETLLHYNGRDFFEYPPLIEEVAWGMWGDGKELFVIGRHASKTLVYHGR
jgi:hypothetical protein